ncbi:hypothetical protein AB0F43_35680 [Kribbella sp. NPDC023972]|uniref:hypothetical protein n=1 Tax=Kribbella sp. NPDC023972 TaxID=3154795 RepID=UPI0033EAE4FD
MSVNVDAVLLSDRVTDALADARRHMRLADGALQDADEAIGRSEADINELPQQARLVLQHEVPRVPLENAQSYADQVFRRLGGAQEEVNDAVRRLDQSAQAIGTARSALQELEQLTPGAEGSGQEEWPKDVPTVAELRERVELFDEALTAATEGAEDAGWRLGKARDSLRTLLTSGTYIDDRQQTAQMIAEAGSNVGRETRAAHDEIKGLGQPFYNADQDSAAALSGASDLHNAVRAGLNPTPRSQQTTPGATVEDPRVAWSQGRDVGQGIDR